MISRTRSRYIYIRTKGEQDEKITDARLQREEEEKKVQVARYPDENGETIDL